MTYYSSYYKSYSWSAFTAADLLAGGWNGSSIGRGDRFVVGRPTVKMSTKDNDRTLSGDDKSWWAKDYSNDRSGQNAFVDNRSIGSKMFAEQYHVLKGSDGKTYYMIEIKIEGYDTPGAGNGFFTFYGKQPPVGTAVTVVSTCDVKGSWIDYSCLGAGQTAPPNTPPKFTNVPADGVYCVDENNKLVVNLNASDKDGDKLTFSIVGGADQAAFTIDPDSGVLRFVKAPDYENPADSDGNNSYKVIVAVSDGKGGVTNKQLTVDVCDVNEGGDKDCIVIEAEDMNLSCYTVRNASSASGNEYIALTGTYGFAKTKFDGPAGEYDFTMRYWDAARDGGYIQVYVNGQAVKRVYLNANDNKWAELKVEGLDLKPGDVITLKGYGRGCEDAIIDKIELCPTEPEILPGALEGRVFCDQNKDGLDNNNEPGVAGVTVQLLNAAGAVIATQTTAADGSYRFDNLDPGQYRVVFPTSFDGKELTDANVGSDDTIDSDANAKTGATGNYTVVAGETVSDVDAGLVAPNKGPVAGDDSAETCVSTPKTVDVLANDSDPDADDLTITSVEGKAISNGQSVTLDDGVVVTLEKAGQLVFDASDSDYDTLVVGQSATATYSYQISDGNGGTASADIDLKYCGSLNTLDSIAASLPDTGTMRVSRDQVGDTFYNVTLTNTGDDRLDGKTFDIAYCVSASEELNFNVNIPVNIYLADESTLPAGVVPNPENLDLINWILNQDFSSQDNGDGNNQTYTEAEIQGAIWGLTDDIVFVNENVPAYGTIANAQEIYDLALANGEGFEAGSGDIVGLVLDPIQPDAAPTEQPLIIGVEWEDLAQDCLCV